MWKYAPTEEGVLRANNVLSIHHVKNNRRKLTISVMGQGTKAALEVMETFYVAGKRKT